MSVHEPSGFVCPVPRAWQEVWKRLLAAREQSGSERIPKPPTPLILAGWIYSDDNAKHRVWNETIAWAKQHGFIGLIPEVPDQDMLKWGEGPSGRV